ncbi:DEFB131B isoform 1 [Pan troglodytes]|uniref:Beta-defensin n=1 Tax=Pan troglodytes TaxID=9598 RepID=A0A2J8Q059_PANTR|nr:DEFB131B isoform 1 [Pan troglodytes]
MRVLFFVFGVLSLMSTVPPTRSFTSNDECPSEYYYHCRLKCNADEHAIRYCADFSICCKLKIIQIDGQKKW